MRRLVLLALCLAAAVPVGVGSATSTNIRVASSVAADLCVGGHAPGCYPTLQTAFDAAHDGDRIRVNPGTYSGGVTVRVSVHIKGAGAASTVISGGGPVLTVGEANAASEPTVTISGVTITRRRLPRGSGYSGPHAVRLRTRRPLRSEVGSRFRPPQATALGRPSRSPTASCAGTGRANDDSCEREGDLRRCSLPLRVRRGRRRSTNWGVLTLKRTRVSDNEVSGAVSDAEGGGILNEHSATLMLEEVVIARNRAVAGVPYGRFGVGGGIFAAGGGAVSIRTAFWSGIARRSTPNSYRRRVFR